MDRMRILLADHHSETLWALKTRFGEEPGIELIGETSEAEALLELAKASLVDLILMDGELPGRPVEILIADLHNLVPKPKVVVMSSNPEYGRKYLKAGADAFVSKTDQPEWLFETLRKSAKYPNKEANNVNSG
jgi:DNA-binding NarL/FixJ family response regulator